MAKQSIIMILKKIFNNTKKIDNSYDIELYRHFCLKFVEVQNRIR